MILIAAINPESSGPCFLIHILILNSNRRVIGVDYFGLQNLFSHQIIKRPQQIGTTYIFTADGKLSMAILSVGI
jgi:hypothetical protein